MNPTHQPTIVTIIIPVYNSAWLAEKAICSALHSHNRTPFQIIVCDDGSDAFTQALIERLVQGQGQVTIQRHEHTRGFIKTVNHALKKCATPYAAIVNSDVVLTDGWLDGLVTLADSDPRIATVNPLTNRASQIEVPLPPGVNFFEVNRYLKNHFQGARDVVTGVGFCMLIRMAALAQVGVLDEIFGAGYCEESDLCMRLTTHGWRTVVAPGVFVYHKGAGSFGDKRERYLHNRRIFDRRWALEYQRQFRNFQRANPLEPVRSRLVPPLRWEPVPHARQIYRDTRTAVKSRQPGRAVKTLVKGALALPRAKMPLVSNRHIAKFKSSSTWSVTYVLPHLTMAGGVISVLQLVNELILLGADARIATLHIYPEMEEWPQYSGWMRFRNFGEMIDRLPPTDMIVATHWTTVQAVRSLCQKGRAYHSIYFAQDYEPWFFPADDKKNRGKVEETYRMLPEKIVKSDWLANMLQPFGGTIHKIPLGMDLQIFYPREKTPMGTTTRDPVILAMARPRTPRRGFVTLVHGLSEVKKKYPHAIVRFFGDDLAGHDIPFDCEALGIVVQRNALAGIYADADIFIDASDFQGFGRPALEAMACGAACVLTNVGGVGEYARNGINALLIGPKDPGALFKAVELLINNLGLRKELVEGGHKTANHYCHKREARQTAELFGRMAGLKGLACAPQC